MSYDVIEFYLSMVSHERNVKLSWYVCDTPHNLGYKVCYVVMDCCREVV